MHITFHGAVRQSSGAGLLVKIGNKQLLIAAGQHLGGKAQRSRNNDPFPFAPETLDAVIVADAHPRIAGLVPKLVRHGLKAPIFATDPVAHWLPVLWADIADALGHDTERVNRHRLRQHLPLWQPAYTAVHAAQAATMIHTVSCGVPWPIDPYVQFAFSSIPHNPVSFNVIISHTPPGAPRQRLLFGSMTALQPGPGATEQTAQTFIWQITNDLFRPTAATAIYRTLSRIVPETFARGGNVYIAADPGPDMQNVMMALQQLAANKIVNDRAVVVDSTAAADITRRLPKPASLLNCRLALTQAHSIALNTNKSGLIIVAASSTGDGGRIKHHLRHNLWRPECTVCFTGPALAGTLGHELLSGVETVRIHGRSIAAAARIEHIAAPSHPGQLSFPEAPAALKRVFLVDGNADMLVSLQQQMQQKIKAAVFVPRRDECVALTPAAVTSIKPGGQTVAAPNAAHLWGTIKSLRQGLEHLERRGVTPETARVLIEQLNVVRYHALISGD